MTYWSISGQWITVPDHEPDYEPDYDDEDIPGAWFMENCED